MASFNRKSLSLSRTHRERERDLRIISRCDTLRKALFFMNVGNEYTFGLNLTILSTFASILVDDLKPLLGALETMSSTLLQSEWSKL